MIRACATDRSRIDAGRPDSQWVADMIGRPAVNTIHAGHIAQRHRRPGGGGRSSARGWRNADDAMDQWAPGR
jgi:hypothetical protein